MLPVQWYLLSISIVECSMWCFWSVSFIVCLVCSGCFLSVSSSNITCAVKTSVSPSSDQMWMSWIPITPLIALMSCLTASRLMCFGTPWRRMLIVSLRLLVTL